jgi:hypothetical protein
MKRLAVLTLLAILIVPCLPSGYAQVMTPEQNAKQSRKADKKHEKALKKANKKQRKAAKKFEKAERKQTKKANKDLQKRRGG